MKLVFQTQDGKTFTDFEQARQHEVTKIENCIGKVIDNDWDAYQQHPSKQKMNLLKFLLDHHGYFIELLSEYRDIVQANEEEIRNDD